MHKSESNPHSGKMWNISRKRAAAVYSPHLNWHSTLAVVPSIFYCDTLHPDSTRFQNPNPEVGCTAIHTLGSNLLWSRNWKFDVLSPALLELSQVVEHGVNYLDLGHFNDVTYSWNIHDFFSPEFLWYNFYSIEKFNAIFKRLWSSCAVPCWDSNGLQICTNHWFSHKVM